MSKWDRVNVAALGRCCVAAVHALARLPLDGEVIACAVCGRPVVFVAGIWTRAKP